MCHIPSFVYMYQWGDLESASYLRVSSVIHREPHPIKYIGFGFHDDNHHDECCEANPQHYNDD